MKFLERKTIICLYIRGVFYSTNGQNQSSGKVKDVQKFQKQVPNRASSENLELGQRFLLG